MRDETKCYICNNPLMDGYGNNGFPLVPKCDYPLKGKKQEGYRICNDCNEFNREYRIFLDKRDILPLFRANLDGIGRDVTEEENEKRDKFNRDLDNLLKGND